MEVALDANVLFRMLISQGDILDILFDDKLKLYAPKRLKEEFLKHEGEVVEKSRLSPAETGKLAEVIFKRIAFLPLEEYKAFIPQAKELLGSHQKDEDFVALCLLKEIKLWTYEKFLFDIGIGISTKEISGILRDS